MRVVPLRETTNHTTVVKGINTIFLKNEGKVKTYTRDKEI
jgi:hypothetical protein